MIKNLPDYIITTLGVLLIGWFFEENKNVSLGFFFYLGIPFLLYGVYYFAEKSLEKILKYLIARNRFKVLYLIPIGFSIGLIGDYLNVDLIKAIGSVIMLFSLFVFFFWKSINKEIKEDSESKSQQDMQ